jgi:hypothetical protein
MLQRYLARGVSTDKKLEKSTMSNVQIPESIQKATATSLRSGIKKHLGADNIKGKLVKELYKDADPQAGGIEAYVFDLKHGNKRLNRQADLAELFTLLSVEANDLTTRKEKSSGTGRIGGFAKVVIGLVKFGATYGHSAVAATEKLSWKGRKLTTVKGIEQLTADLEAEIASDDDPDVTLKQEVMSLAKQVFGVDTPQGLLEVMLSRFSDYGNVCCTDTSQRQFYIDAQHNLLSLQKTQEANA